MEIRFNQRAFDAMAVGPDVRSACREVVEKGKAYAESISPVDSGEYRDSFEVREETIRFAGKPRATAVLENTAKHSAAVEWGNQATRGQKHRVLGRTLDALGEVT